MDDTSSILVSTVERLVADHSGHGEHLDGSWNEAAWVAIVESGLPLALLDEANGGFGFASAEALAAVRIAGGAALPLPLGETMLGAFLLGRADIAVPEGIVTVAPSASGATLERTAAGIWVRGQFARVPYARHAKWIVAPVTEGDGLTLALLDASCGQVTQGENLAGEPRDTLTFDGELVAASVGPPKSTDPLHWRAFGAAIRCQAISGAMEQILAMTLQYAGERSQFGKTLGEFQVIQHHLAVMAGQVVAARGGADMAAEAFGTGDVLPIAIAKARCGEAAGALASLAHQIHGAIGFTREHALHRLTTRLWSWREEFGSDSEWQMLVGRVAGGAGPQGLWPLLTRIS